MFFYIVFDTVKNITINTLTFQFNRKGSLLSEKKKKKKSIGYARAIDNESFYLKEQINDFYQLFYLMHSQGTGL